MVFNSLIVLSVAHISAETWQRIACIQFQDRVNSQQLLDLLFCFPLHQLGRFALYLWTFMCLPPPDSFYSYTYYSSSSDDDDDDDHDHDHRGGHGSPSSSASSIDFDDYYYQHSHSD